MNYLIFLFGKPFPHETYTVREIHRSRKFIFNQLEKVVDDPFQQLVDCFIVAALIEA